MTQSKDARGLLERLASDDAFRERIQKDPVAGFAEYGFVIDPDVAPKTVNLPSKEEIKAGIDLLAKQLDTSVGYIIFAR